MATLVYLAFQLKGVSYLIKYFSNLKKQFPRMTRVNKKQNNATKDYSSRSYVENKKKKTESMYQPDTLLTRIYSFTYLTLMSLLFFF